MSELGLFVRDLVPGVWYDLKVCLTKHIDFQDRKIVKLPDTVVNVDNL